MYNILMLSKDLKVLPNYILGNLSNTLFTVLDSITPVLNSNDVMLGVKQFKVSSSLNNKNNIEEVPEYQQSNIVSFNNFNNIFNSTAFHEVILKHNELPQDMEVAVMREVSRRDVSVSFRGYFSPEDTELVLINNQGVIVFEFNAQLAEYPTEGYEVKSIAELELYSLMEFSDLDILNSQSFLVITLDGTGEPKYVIRHSLTEAIHLVDYLKEQQKPIELLLIKKKLNSNELLSLFEEFKNG